MNILETITERTRERIREQENLIPLSQMRRMAEAVLREEQTGAAAEADSAGERKGAGHGTVDMPAFERALRQPGMSFICEVKKASPSKGIIAEDFPYMDIAKDYEAAGASAISCLTEPYWFLGSDVYLEEIAENVSIPVLRKDFTCSEYMIWQAKALGASAVLLICSVLDDGELRAYHRLTEELHMSALVEAHDADEIERAKQAGARIIGVNNRDLKDFSVDIGHSARLRQLAGEDTVFVSESGIRTPENMRTLCENGTDAVLIGEMLMRAPDRQAALRALKREAAGR
ncbi:MAG TPA: indole-3-glycerol phosphate synthase TrpC [Candidatus Mediterraneibacter faecavium]|uniref:Indole-3-glycerol phosphate synthase n=1 Tax=Candidatus Mediterraneibacter faecavium TaxID=2838668 RepID=A0A9D2TME8_9FIRM|nr:indole-3-glycerol phosphate synthase TrpC [Candidatus Mediterraneibacter faecavium]